MGPDALPQPTRQLVENTGGPRNLSLTGIKASRPAFVDEHRRERLMGDADGASGGILTDEASARLVYVIDDDRDIRLSLSFQLRTLGYAVHPFVAAGDFLAGCADLSPGCILLDIRMPDMDGGEALVAMRARGIDWPVVIITGHADVSIAVDVMKNGAIDFLEKPFDEDQLVAALAHAFALLDAARDRADKVRQTAALLARLTPRETEVLHHMLAGEANKIIAHRLDLSIRTVEMHRASLLTKLGARNLAQAAALVGARLP
jgi:two-component system, LuxR family, response regulator FixJ